jgi:integrase/recombinase XerD
MKFNFTVQISDYLKKDQTAAVFIQYYYKGKRYRIDTGIAIEPEFFKNGKIIKIHPKSKDYNLLLENALGRLAKIELDYRLTNIVLTPNVLLKEFLNPSETEYFYMWAVQELRDLKLSEGSRKAYKAILDKFNEFYPKALFAEMDEKLLNKFDDFMRQKKGNNIDTRKNAHKRMKYFLSIAKKRKMILINPYDDIKIKGVRTEIKRVSLTVDEVRSLYRLYYSAEINPLEKKILRGFLFSCETGIRISDLKQLNRSQIQGKTLSVTMKKTSQPVIIPLTNRALRLIDDAPMYGSIFKTLSDQKINEKLKFIALRAGIKKNITNHVGRHTFATLFWEKTKDVLSLQRILGHENIAQTMVYTHVSKQVLEQQMEKYEAIDFL